MLHLQKPASVVLNLEKTNIHLVIRAFDFHIVFLVEMLILFRILYCHTPFCIWATLLEI
jgi:hypothetical protein